MEKKVSLNEVLNLLNKLEINRGELGIILKDKEFKEGQVILDENGDPVIDVNTGEIKKYPDAYYVEFSNATFGTYKMRVDKDTFDKLEVGQRYILTYALEIKEVVSKSKSGFEYVSKVLQIKPLNFENITNLLVWVRPDYQGV